MNNSKHEAKNMRAVRSAGKRASAIKPGKKGQLVPGVCNQETGAKCGKSGNQCQRWENMQSVPSAKNMQLMRSAGKQNETGVNHAEKHKKAVCCIIDLLCLLCLIYEMEGVKIPSKLEDMLHVVKVFVFILSDPLLNCSTVVLIVFACLNHLTSLSQKLSKVRYFNLHNIHFFVCGLGRA